MWASSEKKISDEMSRKVVIHGVNIKLPTGDMRENEIPHAERMGSDMSVINSCSRIKSSKNVYTDDLILCSMVFFVVGGAIGSSLVYQLFYIITKSQESLFESIYCFLFSICNIISIEVL